MKAKFKWVFAIAVVMMFAGFQAFAADKVPAASDRESVDGVTSKLVVSDQKAPEAANWLSFFAVTPCRLYDSREPNSIGTGGVWWPGRVEGMFIDLADTSAQGGAASCPAPLDFISYGEPDGVHIYMVAIPRPGGAYQGNLLAFPPQYAIPWASALNYKYGVQNVGNALSVQTYDYFGSMSWDLGVINRFGYCDLVVDVFGYYY